MRWLLCHNTQVPNEETETRSPTGSTSVPYLREEMPLRAGSKGALPEVREIWKTVLMQDGETSVG